MGTPRLVRILFSAWLVVALERSADAQPAAPPAVEIKTASAVAPAGGAVAAARPTAVDGRVAAVPAAAADPAAQPEPQPAGELLVPAAPGAAPSASAGALSAPTPAAPLVLDPPLGKASAPDIGGLPLARLLDLEPNWTGLGSFKLRLPRYGISSYIHGITELLFAAQSQNDPASVDPVPATPTSPAISGTPGLRATLPGTPASFAGNFDLFVGADLRNVLFTELELILTSDGGQVDVNFAQIDLRVYRDYLIVRGGKFLVPFGGMNTYPDPVFVFKLPELPLYYSHIVPQRWGEIGVQLYGRYSWAENRALSYAFYVVNGLEQRSGDSGDIGLMKDNLRDAYDADKAVGGQVQIEPIPGFSMGASAYTGVYTQTDSRRLTMGDVHLGLQHKKLTLRAEFAAALQETTLEPLHKYGAYFLASYRAIPYLEPVVMLDYVNLDGGPLYDRYAGTLGLVCYPYPQKAASGAIRTAYSASWDGNGNFAGHRFAAMLVIGF